MYEYIEFIICYGEGIKPEDMKARNRKSEVVFARQLVIYFSMIYKIGTLAEIGRLVGDYDHATILHSSGVIQDYLDTDKSKRAKIEYYTDLIGKVISLTKRADALKEVLRPLEQELSDITKKIGELQEVIKPLEAVTKMMNTRVFNMARNISDLKKKIPCEV